MKPGTPEIVDPDYVEPYTRTLAYQILGQIGFRVWGLGLRV